MTGVPADLISKLVRKSAIAIYKKKFLLSLHPPISSDMDSRRTL
jgi:hypothetical protein